MSKLKFALALPIVQFLLALTAVVWRYKLSAETLLFPAITFFYRGMNAPAWLIGGLIVRGVQLLISMTSLPLSWIDLSVYGIPLREVLFLLLVAAVWFLVGRALDKRREIREPSERALLGRFFWNLLLVVLGVVLMIGAVHGIQDLRSSARLLGIKPFLYFSLSGELFLIGWSSVLILLPGKKVVHALRTGTLR